MTTTRSTDPICDVLLRLRALTGLSLRQVEAKTEGRFRAVTVGSYERGDRRPTVEAARELLDFYGADFAVVVRDERNVVPRDGAS